MADEADKTPESSQYQAAWQEWDSRSGSAKSQANNWRLACLLSMLVTVLLLISIYLLVSHQKRYVYVAEVSANDNVVNVQSVGETYQPNQAQQVYMVGRFIDNIMSLPLDPVVARKQWLSAYNLVSGRAIQELNDFATETNPFADLGELTRTVTIKNFNAIGNHSYEMTWTTTVYNQNGSVVGSTLYSGIFTVSVGQVADNIQVLLDNPYGIKITHFTFSAEGH